MPDDYADMGMQMLPPYGGPKAPPGAYPLGTLGPLPQLKPSYFGAKKLAGTGAAPPMESPVGTGAAPPMPTREPAMSADTSGDISMAELRDLPKVQGTARPAVNQNLSLGQWAGGMRPEGSVTPPMPPVDPAALGRNLQTVMGAMPKFFSTENTPYASLNPYSDIPLGVQQAQEHLRLASLQPGNLAQVTMGANAGMNQAAMAALTGAQATQAGLQHAQLQAQAEAARTALEHEKLKMMRDPSVLLRNAQLGALEKGMGPADVALMGQTAGAIPGFEQAGGGPSDAAVAMSRLDPRIVLAATMKENAVTDPAKLFEMYVSQHGEQAARQNWPTIQKYLATLPGGQQGIYASPRPNMMGKLLHGAFGWIPGGPEDNPNETVAEHRARANAYNVGAPTPSIVGSNALLRALTAGPR